MSMLTPLPEEVRANVIGFLVPFLHGQGHETIQAETMPEIHAETMPEIRDGGYDDRGWAILDAVWSGPGVKTVKMKIRNGQQFELM